MGFNPLHLFLVHVFQNASASRTRYVVHWSTPIPREEFPCLEENSDGISIPTTTTTAGNQTSNARQIHDIHGYQVEDNRMTSMLKFPK